jgi:murein DD-endopeptidase MepM/ murein hydrolase activator NlpD
MAAGVVRMIQHETSWGNLVVIESSLSDSEYVCQIYGHLGKDLDVGVGESVYAGQKIGQIGNSFSYENGGYVGHVHVGIELSRFKSARLGGYDRSVEWYASPKSFVALVAKRAAGRAETDAVQQ